VHFLVFNSSFSVCARDTQCWLNAYVRTTDLDGLSLASLMYVQYARGVVACTLMRGWMHNADWFASRTALRPCGVSRSVCAVFTPVACSIYCCWRRTNDERELAVTVLLLRSSYSVHYSVLFVSALLLPCWDVPFFFYYDLHQVRASSSD